jgi:hypothetical protein
MAQRPFLTGLLVVGIAASALRAGRGPEPASGLANNITETGSTVSGQETRSSSDVDSWSKQLDNHPRNAGSDAGRQGLDEKICGFVSGPPDLCSSPATAFESDAHPQYGSEIAEVMIAIVPDPIHTHLALTFDRAIDALEDALQDSGWQYQDYWFPWSSRADAKSEPSEMEKRLQQRLYDDGREESPGLLLFRAPGKPHPLVVFLVAESPTSGINQTQFRKAILYSSKLAAEQQQLNILGPSFSGSGPSLRFLLAEAKRSTLKAWPVTIASGSVSDSNCGDFLAGGAMKAGECNDAETPPDTFASFSSAFNCETEQTEKFLEKNGGLQEGEIAELAEDESAFGNLSAGKGCDDDNTHEHFLRLMFPRGISHLRSAYQKNGVWGFGGTANGNSVSLTLNFDEPHYADDSVPSFATQQTPVSQEGSMGQIAAILEQRHIKVVLLSATDVMDELFVTQMLARQAPSVTVVVHDTDVLFLGSAGGVYHNMYAVSPWPLIPENRRWSRPEGDATAPRLFPDGVAEGLYNATRYLFEGKAADLKDYSSPIYHTSHPPLWFSAIGHGAYWPVALLPADSTKRSVPNLPGVVQSGSPRGISGDSEPIPRSLLLAILIGCVVSLLHAGKCLGWRLLDTVARARYNLGDETTRSPRLWLELWLSMLGVLMLCLLAVPSKVLAVWGQWPVPVPDFRTGVPIGISMIFLSWATTGVCWKLCFKERSLEKVPKLPIWGWVLGTLLLFFAACLVWILVWCWITPNSTVFFQGLPEFFFYRSNYPLSGSSPVLPLLLCLSGIALALFNYLDRLTFGKVIKPRLPATVDCIPNFPTEKSMEPVTNLLAWPRKWKIGPTNLLISAFVIVAALIFGWLMHLWPRTLEGTNFQIGLRALMYVVLIVLLRDLAISAILWRRLKRTCLDPLESGPLRRGFSAIDGVTWKDLWLVPQSLAGRYRLLLRALEQIGRRVMDCEAGVPLDDGESVRDAAASVWRNIESAKANDAIAESFGDLQRHLAGVAQVILRMLCVSWKNELSRITATDNPEEMKHTEAPEDNAKRPLADRLQEVREEWVALIYLHYVRLVLLQIRSRFMSATILYLLLVWATTSYPYINRHTLMVGLIALLGVLTVVVVWTFSSINRDPILSRTTEHQPGKLDFDFYLKTASMVGIPLLGLIASQFPEVSNFLFSWIEPGMSVGR